MELLIWTLLGPFSGVPFMEVSKFQGLVNMHNAAFGTTVSVLNKNNYGGVLISEVRISKVSLCSLSTSTVDVLLQVGSLE